MDLAGKISQIIAKAADTKPELVKLEHPQLEEHGDYSTNIALVLKGGRKLAEEIAEKIKGEFIENVEVAGPGFINITIKPQLLLQSISLKGLDTLRGTKIMFEYGTPNTHKLPHIGHLFSYVYGQAMFRILEAEGAEVRKDNYQGDIGLHVAKCLWAFKKNSPDIPDSLSDKVILLQKMYQLGSAAYDENEEAKKEIYEVNKKIYNQDLEIMDLWQQTRQWSLDYYQKFEARLGAEFDQHYFESQIHKKGKQIVLDNTGKVFIESQGAIVFEGPHTRVFVTSEGNPTYEAKELALELQKMVDWPADLILITTASEQNAYFEVVFAALEKLDPAFKGKLKHVGFGMVNLTTGKMASRTGKIIGGIELVDKVVDSVSERSAQANVAEAVGIGAIKYAFLKKGPTQDMEFDIESSISIEGNSGPYLQYTYARIQSLINKSQTQSQSQEEAVKFNPEELKLVRWMYRFSEVVSESAGRYAPNLLTNFLYELAQRYNTFYNKHHIGDSGYRIKLSQKVGEVLKAGLQLLGIEALESM